MATHFPDEPDLFDLQLLVDAGRLSAPDPWEILRLEAAQAQGPEMPGLDQKLAITPQMALRPRPSRHP